jgi:hypothetical protein
MRVEAGREAERPKTDRERRRDARFAMWGVEVGINWF